MKKRWLPLNILVFLFAFIFLFTALTTMKVIIATLQTLRYYPIVFVPGLGLQTKDYQSLITNLTNDHYQVMTFTPDYSDASNYQYIVKEWSSKLGKQIGNKKVIVIGHSVGGSVATYFCSIDKRCVAGINMDGAAAFDTKIPVPFLYLQADTGSYCDTQCFEGRTLMEHVASESGSMLIHINGIKHYNFTDLRTQTLKHEDYLGSQDGRTYIYARIKIFLKQIPQNDFLF